MPKKSEDITLNVPYEKSIENNEETLQKILILIKDHTGHDFSFYKESTVTRRTKRRMHVHQLDSLNEYYNYIEKHPNEINTLFNDLLINVTSFFRDSNAFDIFEKELISEVLDKKVSGDTVRIWIPGCATGEEVYSVAVIIYEYMEKSGKHLKVRIFGTDIDDNAILTARSSVYPCKIAEDITSERLNKFFIKKDDNYKVKKNIREMAIFALHDILIDSPFSKIDVISCRNVLIYMNKDAQNKILSAFIYALKPNGILFLGPSESISTFAESLHTLSSKWKIYQLKEQNMDI
ncbi:CheR family methyltransferase [Methanobacterium sp.]|uniref:CheR family methyltransferase n=1 Tax=Methanobacterium sp. TaxID=2164 RepID=UPI003C72FD03